jgi:hypothetical protein
MSPEYIFVEPNIAIDGVVLLESRDNGKLAIITTVGNVA